VDHSDAGSQYTSIRYSARLADAGAVASIGTDLGPLVQPQPAHSALGHVPPVE
jgi:putative transposase